MMKSSKLSEKESSAAARMPGSTRGRVIRRKVCHSLAYRSMAASSSRRSMPASRAFTVTTTNDTQNITCAMTMVQKPCGTPAATKRASSEVPITSSGVAIGRKISPLIPARPLKPCRTRANAISVPRTVATNVAIRPISMLRPTASHMSAVAQGCFQLSRVNSLKS